MAKEIVMNDFEEVQGVLVYKIDGVLVQENKQDQLHSGKLEIRENKHGSFIFWNLDPAHQSQEVVQGGTPDNNMAAVDTNLNKVKVPVVRRSSRLVEKQFKIGIEVTEIKSYKLTGDGNVVTIMMKDGTTHNNLIFLDESPAEFIECLEKYVSINKSSSDEHLYILSDKATATMDSQLSQLNVMQVSRRRSTDIVWSTMSDFQKDPYTTSLSIFAKLADKIVFNPGKEDLRKEEEVADILQSVDANFDFDIPKDILDDHDENEDWQLVTKKIKVSDLKTNITNHACHRSPPLSQLDWEFHTNKEGVVQGVNELLSKIFKGGVEKNMRSEVWKYLLGYYQWDHPVAVREEHRKLKVEEYLRMKLQWKSMSEEQQSRFADFKKRKLQIEKDVGRTDRDHPFYAGENNRYIFLLHDILMTYVMYNFDLGYVQGMCDLLSPLLFVMESEADAFWCFVGFMNQVASNFELDQMGMKRQLANLAEIIKFVDPVFFEYLEAAESSNLFFCFRGLLIWFKREFNYNDTMTLWEVLWTKKPCKNFQLLVCAAILDTEKSVIVENQFGLTEILKHVNDMSHRIDLQQTLNKAEEIFESLKCDNTRSDNLIDILGLGPFEL